jgi:hypothetical protein
MDINQYNLSKLCPCNYSIDTQAFYKFKCHDCRKDNEKIIHDWLLSLYPESMNVLHVANNLHFPILKNSYIVFDFLCGPIAIEFYDDVGCIHKSTSCNQRCANNSHNEPMCIHAEIKEKIVRLANISNHLIIAPLRLIKENLAFLKEKILESINMINQTRHVINNGICIVKVINDGRTFDFLYENLSGNIEIENV